MIDSLTAHFPANADGHSTSKDVVDSNQIAFSFPSAIAALEKSAAQSLQVFGPTPNNGAPVERTAKHSVSAANSLSTNAQTAPASAEKDAPSANSSSDAEGAAPTDRSLTAKSSLAPINLPQSPPNVASLSLGPQLSTPSAPSSTPGDRTAGSVTSIDSNQRTAKSTASLPTAPRTTNTGAEFARILAQRLDQGVTKFEIRLDPPSLGRIDASISVNDKGAQELSIRFDNQAAFEQFSRDENAIRLALSDFGFELGDGKMKFVPPEDIKSPDGDPNVTSTAPTQAPFLAPLRPHDIVGVLDIHA